MCGIAGVVGDVDGTHRATVREMCDALAHRGPDSDGFFDGEAISMGMRRLAIIDVASGTQPVEGEGGRVVAVFNGEIYNHEKLRQGLMERGHRFSSDSDSEVLPHLYEDHGDDFVHRCRGMFAAALWDRASQRLTLARDRVGKKPLYYWNEGPRLWFASEISGLLRIPHFPRRMDSAAIHMYLTYQYVPHPMSAFQGVRKLPPGHTLVWAKNHISVQRYWAMPATGALRHNHLSEEEMAGQLRERLLDATGVRLGSERPVGAFLSGGLDSSAVVAAMARTHKGPVETFSIGFGDSRYNELQYAKKVADIYSDRHHTLVVEPEIQQDLPKIVRAFGEPFADSSAVPSFYVAQMARQKVVVVLNGDGGDEAFAGYRRYSLLLRSSLREYPQSVSRIANLVSRHFAREPNSAANRFHRTSTIAGIIGARTPAERYLRLVSYFSDAEKTALYRPHFAEEVSSIRAAGMIEDAWAQGADLDPVNRIAGVDIATYLPGDLLPKVDITTMANSLEARSPLLDHEFLEWSAMVPGDFKIRHGQHKYLLKKAMEPWLPKEVIYRSKQGFAIPRDEWLQGPLRGLLEDTILAPDSRISSYLDPGSIRGWVHRNDRAGDAGARVWALLMLEMWHREVLES